MDFGFFSSKADLPGTAAAPNLKAGFLGVSSKKSPAGGGFLGIWKTLFR
jgi:hypothetical protein